MFCLLGFLTLFTPPPRDEQALNTNQVIRHKFVAMASRIEALQAWTEWAASQV
jgi:hypothetical protein